MPDAQLSNQCIDSAHLHTCTTTTISKVGGFDMVLSRGAEHGQHGKVSYDLLVGACADESLQQLLQNKPGGKDDIATRQGTLQRENLRNIGDGISSQGE